MWEFILMSVCAVAFWGLLGGSWAASAWLFARAKPRRPPTRCLCGYDLQGLPHNASCPECAGTERVALLPRRGFDVLLGMGVFAGWVLVDWSAKLGVSTGVGVDPFLSLVVLGGLAPWLVVHVTVLYRKEIGLLDQMLFAASQAGALLASLALADAMDDPFALLTLAHVTAFIGGFTALLAGVVVRLTRRAMASRA